MNSGWGIEIERGLDLLIGSPFGVVLLEVGECQIGIWLRSKGSVSRRSRNSNCTYLLLNIGHACPLLSSCLGLLANLVSLQRVELGPVEGQESTSGPLGGPVVHNQVVVSTDVVPLEPAASGIGLLDLLGRVGLDESGVGGLLGFGLGPGELSVSL